ncbi:hypothetical protein WHR41_08802 [Cladosporium halotolerans]|uniref:F-box domain-containing protein n=1 Tax=Cladosporium halotolerans TaxID=1052096 RepID=A0AB34KBS7_9PEZI
MEAAPPSYEKATLVDYLDLVANYIPSSDLCSAALVCSKWHTTFSPHLWGNPASHFGIENDRVYVALTKFKRTLQTARLLVRSQTHTLHLPPAHAEIYNGPHSDWLRDILSRLPNLQSLIVRGLPFFDHAALIALRQWKPAEANNAPVHPQSFAVELPGSAGSVFQPPPNAIPSFGLRLLDASRCPNVTSSGLAQALKRFESLMYLDLSHTYPARDRSVLESFRRFPGLQVLKLRGISLRDEEIEVLAWAIGRRVRSLDLRDNHITDRGVRMLLDGCFTSQDPSSSHGVDYVPQGARSPSLLPYLGAEMLDIYQSEEFEGFIRGAFTGAFVSRLAIEDAPEGGITHLYISNNKVTVEGASGLIRSGRLHVLDVGSITGAIERHLSVPSDEVNNDEWQLPGAEKLTPVLHDHAREGLTYLKVDHRLLTKDVPNTYSDEVVPGRTELADTALPEMPNSNIFELGGNRVATETFELPTGEQTPRYELEADPMQFVVSPAEHNVDEAQPRRGSALAPEVVDNLAAETNTMKLLDPKSPVSEATLTATGFGTMSTVSPVEPSTPVFAPQQPSRPRSLSNVVTERKARLNEHRSQSHNLHPAMLPRLRTLIITNFPPFSTDEATANRLICFVKNCAHEAHLAQAQATLDYSLPPGRKGQATALRHSANKIFALKKIVIEMAPEHAKDSFGQASPWQHLSTKSMTEDRDSEALWSAAETDFSFFGEEDECAFPSIETGRFAGVAGSAEKEVTVDNGWSAASPRPQSKSPEPPKIDNIALLSAFRKERKLANQRSLACGVSEPETEGFWDGAIQVVRPSRGFRDGEELDYYGNKFEKNYLYR